MPATPLPLLALPLPGHRAGASERILPRHHVPFDVRLVDEPSQRLKGVNLSMAGMLCTSDAPLWPGNKQVFELALPGSDDIVRLTGRVVELVPPTGGTHAAGRDDEVAMRVRFENATVANLRMLSVCLARLAAAPTPP